MLALFNIEDWLDKGGLALAAAIIFAETGLLIGFFLPGDSLLFVAGFLSSKPKGLPHLPSPGLVVPLLIVAAFVGNQLGYIIGRSFGPSVFDRPEGRLFNRRNVARTHAFFERHGTKALVLARFVPIVRTFVPWRSKNAWVFSTLRWLNNRDSGRSNTEGPNVRPIW